MDKQKLAQTIWSSADELRGKVEAVEYKNYVLGLLFYKFLSDKELEGLYSEGWTDEYIETEIPNCVVIRPRALNGFGAHQRASSVEFARHFSISNISA